MILNVQDGYKPAMMYGAECWAVRKEQRKLHTTEMRVLIDPTF